MLMGPPHVRMGVNESGAMMVPVGVNEMGAAKKRFIVKDVPGRAQSCGLPAFEDQAPVRDILDDLKVVGGGDDRLGSLPRDETVDDMTLRRGIQPGGRLVEQEHLRFEHENGCQGHAFLFPAGKPVRSTRTQMGELHFAHRLLDAVPDDASRPAELERPESDLVEHGGIEELDFGILENQGDTPSEIEGEVLISEERLAQRPPAKFYLPLLREEEGVEHLQEGGFAGAVCSENCQPLARLHGEAKIAQSIGPLERETHIAQLKKHARLGHRPIHTAPPAKAISAASAHQSRPRIVKSSSSKASPENPRDSIAE